jgi:hypothetical protein
MNKQIIRRNFINMMDNQFVMEFHKKTPRNIRIHIEKFVYNVLYLIFLFYLIYIVQGYKRITDQQQYELMIYISGIINSTMSTISKIPVLRNHMNSFVIEKYALYATSIHESCFGNAQLVLPNTRLSLFFMKHKALR